MPQTEYQRRWYLNNRERIIKKMTIYSRTPAYRFWKRWNLMMERCYNSDAKGFKYWGGRGIKVCKRWHVFENFKTDMADSFLGHLLKNGPVNTTLDRVDTNRDYSKKNCKWATMKQQQNNRRNNLKNR